ncbi:hypothetical protein [Heliophilum fasciatum]|uniref:Copper amine oxidase-like protein n=1 Tax=Heliophilum fasciatum TaxID=35700 RepID=A0A4R2S4E3_9FIRM|nr:hypothetical protein [Heliophilum fasciatum]MCW2277385.1 hypothetical protein [Heliophilum fasciatum]TCP67221.1 copper amine oxidase-like protein [Heliophilum fasciatum]
MGSLQKTMIVGIILCIILGSTAMPTGEARLRVNALTKTPRLVLNGLPLELDKTVKLINGQLYAPLYPVAEALGAEVQMMSKERRALIRRDRQLFEVKIPRPGTKTVKKYADRSTSITGVVDEQQLMVPVRWLARNLADSWEWDGKAAVAWMRGGQPWQDHDYIAFVRWGELQWMRVLFMKNQEVLRQRGLEAAPPIQSLQDLTLFLGSYWSDEALQSLWEQGQMGKTIDGQWGFNEEGFLDPTQAESWRVLEREGDHLRIQAQIPATNGDVRVMQTVIYELRRDRYGSYKIMERLTSNRI